MYTCRKGRNQGDQKMRAEEKRQMSPAAARRSAARTPAEWGGEKRRRIWHLVQQQRNGLVAFFHPQPPHLLSSPLIPALPSPEPMWPLQAQALAPHLPAAAAGRAGLACPLLFPALLRRHRLLLPLLPAPLLRLLVTAQRPPGGAQRSAACRSSTDPRSLQKQHRCKEIDLLSSWAGSKAPQANYSLWHSAWIYRA